MTRTVKAEIVFVLVVFAAGLFIGLLLGAYMWDVIRMAL